jgi:hypothetical protein
MPHEIGAKFGDNEGDLLAFVFIEADSGGELARAGRRVIYVQRLQHLNCDRLRHAIRPSAIS